MLRFSSTTVHFIVHILKSLSNIPEYVYVADINKIYKNDKLQTVENSNMRNWCSWQQVPG
jgi:hypothetical protein